MTQAKHWRSYTDDPLPAPAEAPGQPFGAFPSWLLRIECDRCNTIRLFDEAHLSPGERATLLRIFLARVRHEGCGGRAGRAELLSDVEGVSGRPVHRIVLRGE